MLQIKLNDRLSDLIVQGFDKTVYGITYGEFASLAGPELFDQTFNRIKTWQAPMYFGEAEIMLLKPLAAYCLKKEGNLPSRMFATAGAFGIIDEIAQLSATRDLAAGLSKDIVLNNPVIQQLILAGILNSPNSELVDKTASVGDGPSVTIDANPKEVMSIITRALSGTPLMPSTNKEDIITILNATYSMGSVDQAQTQISTLFSDLQMTMKMGKRYPMTDLERKNYFTNLIQPIANRLAELSDTLFSSKVALDEASYNTWANFLVIIRWFNFYLDCVEKYDECFPTQLIPSQSQMQVMELSRAANKYKGVYLKLSQAGMTSAIGWSLRLWDEMFKFYQPVMPQTSAVHDLELRVDELKSDYEKVKDPWADSIVEKTIERIKTLSQVDVLLDKNVSSIAQIPNLVHSIVEKAATAHQEIPTGEETLTHIGRYSQAFKFTTESRNALLTVMSNISSAFNSTISAMMQAHQFITRDYKLPILQSMLPDSRFEYQYPASPMTLLPVKASFRRADDTVRSYTPWTIENGAVKWVNLSHINKLVRAKALQDQMIAASPSTIYWPPMDPIQVGEPYIALFAKQPVLATYTQNVTSDMLPNRWSSWFKIWATHNPETRPENALALAATALAQDEARNGGPIATAFAATCAIAHWTDWQAEPSIIEPNIPWVYGVSWNDMITANQVVSRIDTTHEPSMIWSLPAMEEYLTIKESGIWYVNANSMDGTEHHYAFVLWQVAPGLTDLTTPEAQSVRWTLYQIVKGSYFSVPCRREYYPSKKYFTLQTPGKSIVKATDFPVDKDGVVRIENPESYWQIVRGLCPVSLTLPHITWDLATSAKDALTSGSELVQEIYSFINIPVKFKFNEYDKSISFMAYYNNPVVLIEYQDFEDEANKDKILPSQEGRVAPTMPDLNVDHGAQAPAGQDNASPVHSTLAPPADVSSVDNATNAVPITKVEVAGDSLAQPAKGMPNPDWVAQREQAVKNGTSLKNVSAPQVIVDKATSAKVQTTLAKGSVHELSEGDLNVSDSGDTVFKGEPSAAISAEESLGAVEAPDRSLMSKPGSSNKTSKKKKKDAKSSETQDDSSLGEGDNA